MNLSMSVSRVICGSVRLHAAKNGRMSINGVQMMKFGEYQNTLYVPTSLNMVRFRPLKGTALITMEARLCFHLGRELLGGDGRFHAKIEGRKFTPTER
ncbi:hypothetical protein O9993_02365 [Vibrio lentus]|nr:hypothetical protein [Vibrio lentus]